MIHTLAKHSLYTDFIPDIEKWTFSMLEYSLKNGMITPKQVELIQLDIMKIMSENVLKYTQGKSASVKTDVGIDLYNGVVYTLDAYFRSFNDMNDAFEKLMTFEVSRFYQTGQNCIKAKMAHLELSYKYLKSMHLALAIDAYIDTIYNGLELFFKNYDYEFMPNLTSGMIDYPLFYDPMKEIGIWYVEYYIKTLNLENDFCHNYDENDILSIVALYARNYDMAPENLINNVSEILLKQSIASTLLERAVRNLFLKPSDIKLLHEKFKAHPDPEALFADAFYEAIDTLMPSAKSYFRRGFPSLLTQFKLAFASENLAHFFTL
ncbi:DUF6179 domain-containing protein [Fusibacter ferrireducens]|uniref:Uncharacterized protein n=1 Tax=Fusibacter ferrireducens TaxID=2785058 RepID=A0ABR9ZN33_9FIRM|nr:DUF6179 domain-containing protein [Fusibacter ferrireducens]MBF4691824.1 hypothetical protein [Fusibacter ferrireducens]